MTSPELDSIEGREPVLGDPNCVRVLFDIHPPITLSVSDWIALGLKVGAKLSLAHMDAIKQCSDISMAERMAKVYLTGRIRTCAQVQRYLQDRGIRDDIISSVIPRLQHLDILNDEQYAQWFVESMQSRYGRQQLVAKLVLRGIDPELAKAVVEANVCEAVEQNAVEQAAFKFLRRHGKPENYKDKLRLMQHLERKGYPRDLIRAVTERVIARFDM